LWTQLVATTAQAMVGGTRRILFFKILRLRGNDSTLKLAAHQLGG
jgi:hypothetical protein